MLKESEKPKIQLLLLFCAVPVVLTSLILLIGIFLSLAEYHDEWLKDLIQSMSAISFASGLIILLVAEYYSIICRSEKGALTASIICLAAMNLFLMMLMGKIVEILGMVRTTENSNASTGLNFFVVFVVSVFISFGHLRWYLKIERCKTKGILSGGEFEYIGFGKRLIAFLIDLAVGVLFTYVINIRNMVNSLEERSLLPLIFQNFILVVITILFVVKFGGTPGKLILGVRIVDKGGKFLTLRGAILRMILYLPNFFFYLLKMNNVHANMPGTANIQTLKELFETVKLYGGIYSNQIITVVLFLIPIADSIFILFTDKKRAIHDFLAGSYVVSKKSCFETVGKEPDKVLTIDMPSKGAANNEVK
jgi:uncharacterized RDD family membrane protein YckC